MFVNFAFLRETVVLLINYLHYAVYFLIREPLKRNLPTTFCFRLDGIAKKRTKIIKKRSEIASEALLQRNIKY